ncbi:hypothetical protein SO802_028455 [Lithocarpus litseifolius]|uniref:Uncharacterized protein n=1 Tax=Lithocarpus litseifolius TaxID=425828 RepID=A0AAW2BQC1_9ROSI
MQKQQSTKMQREKGASETEKKNKKKCRCDLKDRSHANISAVPQGPSIRAMEIAIPGASSRTQVRTELEVPPPEPSTRLISAQPSSQAVNLQSGFLPADLPEPSVVGPSSSKKRQKNQEEADKKSWSELSLAALLMTKAPPSSLA